MKLIVKGGRFLNSKSDCSFYDSLHCRCILVLNRYSLNDFALRLLIDRHGIRRQISHRLTVDVNEFRLLNYLSLAADQRWLIELIREALTVAFCEDIALMVEHKCQRMDHAEVAGYDTLRKFLSEILVDFLLRHLPLHLWILANHIELNLDSFFRL